MPKPPPKAARSLLRQLARVDWLRVGQRAAVFFRETRGDSHEQINADHLRELARSEKLRTTIENWAEGLKNG